MAKSKGPLFSLSASGSVGKSLTYYDRKEGTVIRYLRRKKEGLPSAGQANNRSLYRLALWGWSNLTENEKEYYNNSAKLEKKTLSGWNFYLSSVINDPFSLLSLRGYWSFNTKDLTSYNNLSSENISLTLGPSSPDSIPLSVSIKNKKLLNGLDFDNGSVYLSMSEQPFANNSFTFSCWVYWGETIPSGSESIFNNNVFMLRKTSSGSYRFIHGSLRDSDEIIGESVVAPIFTGGWKNIVFVWQPPERTIYINGVFGGNLPLFNTSLSNNFVTARLGLGYTTSESTMPFNGVMDEVMFFNRPLTAPEIMLLYKLNK